MLGRATLQCRHCAQFAGGGGVILQSSKGAKEAMREAQEEAPPRVGGSQEEEHLFDAFSFMTYNIMHKVNNNNGMQSSSRYYYCSPANLHFGNRLEKLTKRIAELSPDILCLQVQLFFCSQFF
eukprot:GHVS01021623.1.p1 GENE.GHVS01021623.1~~GHVS01021623.1.p1  ORF type:complete len:123 (-),score=32.52 GHVS01021623.1:155-523(-)